MIYNFLSIYIVLLVCKELGKLGGVIRSIFLGILYFLLLVNVIALVFTHQMLNHDSINILAGTNLSESAEFIHTILTFQTITYLSVLIVILIVVGYCLNKAARLFHKGIHSLWNQGILVFLLILSLAGTSHYTMATPSFGMSILGVWNAICGYDFVSEIHPSNPQLNTTSSSNIPTIVVIIGESASRLHCSLFGYEKETNPYTSALSDSLLHIYPHVESSGVHTIEAFYRFMTIAENDDSNYDIPNVIEIARKAGYKVSWISNQSERGMCDNKVAIFAHFCDTTVFNGNKIGGSLKTDKDGDLLPVVETFTKMEGMNLIFVHLMGSHEMFSSRYPLEFEKFKPEDYKDYPENQRNNLASYDNSILYSDYVVAKTFEYFSKKDAIVFYFSDHGLDIFNTNPNYCAHAIAGDKQSVHFGKQIPFMVYTTADFRRAHPSQLQMIEQSTEMELKTGDFPYMLMQLMGVTFTDRANKYPFTAKSDDDEHTASEL
jgi:glucan phosphoethanolaminetransferase (alkaline phosphatase superfamily)